MQLFLSIILFSLFIVVKSHSSKHNGFANPSLDFPFARVFVEHKNRDLLIKFLNDMIEPNYNEKILEIEKGPTLYPAVKAARRLTVFDVTCKSKTGTIIVQIQLKHVNFFFKKEAQTDIVWKYFKEAELIQNSYNARPVRLLIVSNCLLFSSNTSSPLCRHKWMDERTHEVVFKDLSMIFFEIPKCRINYVKDIHNSIDLWCYFFTQVCKAPKQEISSLEHKFPVMKKALDSLHMDNWDEGAYRDHDYLVDKQLRDVLRDDAVQRSKETEIPKLKNKIVELERQLEKIGNSADKDREGMKIKRQILDIRRKISDSEEWLERVKADAEIQKKYAAYEVERSQTDAKEAQEGVTRAMGVNVFKDTDKTIGGLKETKKTTTTVLKDTKKGVVNAKETSKDVKGAEGAKSDVIKAKEAEEIAKFEGIEKKLMMIQKLIKMGEKWFTESETKEKTGEIENKEKIVDEKNGKMSVTKIKRTEIDGTKVKTPKNIANTNTTMDVVKRAEGAKIHVIEAGEVQELSEREKEIAEIENVEKKLLMIRNMIAEREKWITELENKEKIAEIENKKKNEKESKAGAGATKVQRAEEDAKRAKKSNEIAKTPETPETAAVSYLDDKIDESEKEIAAIQKLLSDHGKEIAELTNQDILGVKQGKENISKTKAEMNNGEDVMDIAMREKQIADYEKKLKVIQDMIADREIEIAKAQNEEITRVKNAKKDFTKVKKDKENVEKTK